MFVVDASVWVGRFVPTDAHHGTARDWIRRRLDQGQLLVAPSLVLAEIAGAVARRTGSAGLAARAIDLMQRLPQTRLVPVEADLARSSARLVGELKLRGADAVYVALAQRLGIPLVTWDRDQLERARLVVVARVPV